MLQFIHDKNESGNRWERLKNELRRGKVRVIRLRRENRLEQAVAVYRRGPVEVHPSTMQVMKHRITSIPRRGMKDTGVLAGQHHNANIRRPIADPDRLEKILLNLDGREEKLDAVVKFLDLPTLRVSFEELTQSHRGAINKISKFIGVPLSHGKGHSAPTPDAEQAKLFQYWISIVKDYPGPRSLCYISNYRDICMRFSKTVYAQFLPDPCSPGVWNCCKCKPPADAEGIAIYNNF